MARTFSGSEAKELKRYFEQTDADITKESLDALVVQQGFAKLVDEAIAAKVQDCVSSEYVDVIIHEDQKALAQRMRSLNCTTIGTAYAQLNQATVTDHSKNARAEANYINGAVGRFHVLLRDQTRLALDEDTHTRQLNKLMLTAYRYLESQPFLDQCQVLSKTYDASIKSALHDLQRGTRNNLTWLFVSQEEKEAAQRAYDYLSDLRAGEYGQRTAKCLQALETLRLTTEKNAWAAYGQKPDTYVGLLAQSSPDKVYRSSVSFDRTIGRVFPAKRMHTLVDTAQNSLGWLSFIAAYNDENPHRTAVVKAANEMVASESMDILSGIPIDEINRDKQGIRVGYLKEAGYTSVADLADVSVFDLEEIKGISEEGAETIKRAYKTLANRVISTTKIRLTTDKQTETSSALVLAVYRFITKRSLSRESRNLLDEHTETIQTCTNVLRRSGGDIGWIIAPTDNRNAARNAYNLLSGATGTAFITESTRIIEEYLAVGRDEADVAWADFAKRPVAYINALEEIVPDLVGSGGEYGLPEDLAREVQEQPFYPEGLNCQLRRYQEWGVRYILHQGKVLLGDEMGLGKTVEAIAVMVSLRNEGETHFVVVCPASVLSNWCREIRKMSDLVPFKVHGNARDLNWGTWFDNGGVAVTTYETIGKLVLPEDCKVGLLVVDEAHYVKNPGAQRTKNVKALCTHSDRLLFMTGTALENRVDEMVNLIGMLQPEIAKRINGIESLSNAPVFREYVAPVYFRRRREDVLTELPDKEEIEDWCDLGEVEEKAYEEAVLSKNFQEARRVSWNVDDLSESCKAKRLLEIVGQAELEGRKVLVFTFFLDTIRKVRDLLGEKCVGTIDGSVPAQKRQEIVDGFDAASEGSVLVAQIQTGGTGLNIQSASVVVICEPQLKPSTENQAISRAYRMGQTRKVLVYRLLCEDTIDERITRLLAEKQNIFDKFADVSVTAMESIELDAKTLNTLLEEEAERIMERTGAAMEPNPGSLESTPGSLEPTPGAMESTPGSLEPTPGALGPVEETMDESNRPLA